MTLQAAVTALFFAALLGSLLALCSYVACQTAGELTVLGSRRLGHAAGQMLLFGWFAALALVFLGVAVGGAFLLFRPA